MYLYCDPQHRGNFGRENGPVEQRVHAQGTMRGLGRPTSAQTQTARIIAAGFNNLLRRFGFENGLHHPAGGFSNVEVHIKKLKGTGMHRFNVMCGGYKRKDHMHAHFREHQRGMSEQELIANTKQKSL